MDAIKPPTLYTDWKCETKRSRYYYDRSQQLSKKHGGSFALPLGQSDAKFLASLEEKVRTSGDERAFQYLERYKLACRRAAQLETEKEEGQISYVPVLKDWSLRKTYRISRGKRLWLKALKKITQLRNKSKLRVTGSVSECTADVVIREDGEEMMILTTSPQNADKVAMIRNVNRKVDLRMNNDERGHEYECSSLTLEDVLEWYSDKRLSDDDRLMQASESAGRREYLLHLEYVKQMKWFSLPDPIVEVGDVSAELISLEVKLGNSISQVRELIQVHLRRKFSKVLNEQDVFDEWKSDRVPDARMKYLSLEIQEAVQDECVMNAANQAGIKVLESDRTSRIREERSRWRDFCRWYYVNPCRAVFLHSHAKALDTCIKSSWYSMHTQLGEIEDPRIASKQKPRDYSSVDTVVGTLKKGISFCHRPFVVDVEAFQPIPADVLAERDFRRLGGSGFDGI